MSPFVSLIKDPVVNIRRSDTRPVKSQSPPQFAFQRIRMIASAPRLVPHVLIMLTTGNSDLLKADIACWAKTLHFARPTKLSHFLVLFVTLMTFMPEFRNLFYVRSGLKGKLFFWMCPPRASLEITPGDIGPGLFIQHGNGTLISAQSIGANCWINQQVTIGYSNDVDRPTIGNNVRIFAGAKIIGRVRIGDNATVGANTVVVRDVAPGTTVFGVPGKVIWRSSH